MDLKEIGWDGTDWIKMKTYQTIIRPVITNSSETWTLTAKDENKLRIFERQILRKIFGPANIDNTRRI
jgi:dissimilatory sulfite reductase (desulfoviridin) alpha/beta subunit